MFYAEMLQTVVLLINFFQNEVTWGNKTMILQCVPGNPENSTSKS